MIISLTKFLFQTTQTKNIIDKYYLCILSTEAQNYYILFTICCFSHFLLMSSVFLFSHKQFLLTYAVASYIVLFNTQCMNT